YKALETFKYTESFVNDFGSRIHKNRLNHIRMNYYSDDHFYNLSIRQVLSLRSELAELIKEVNDRKKSNERFSKASYEERKSDFDGFDSNNTKKSNQKTYTESYLRTVLELPMDYTLEDLNKCYKKQLAKYHPDRLSHLGPDFE